LATGVTLKAPLEESNRCTMSNDDDPFPDLSRVPVYDSFFNHPEEYQRYHIHLIGAEKNQDGGVAIDKRRNQFGRPRVVDAIADPYVTVETVGDQNNTGSTSYFPVGKHTFPVLENSSSPLWDAKAMIMGKKRHVQGLRFQLLDKNSRADDEVLMEFTLDKSEIPTPTPLRDSIWTEYRKAGTCGRLTNMVLVFRIMVTSTSDQMVNKETSRAFQRTSKHGYVYTEVVLPDEMTGDDNDSALLQCWRLPANNNSEIPKKAVLWILGRNDVFMHSHVASRLFKGHDLYVLNYKQNGHTRKRGWVTDAHYNSHNTYGDFNVYNRDIAASLELIRDIDYEQLLGYAHSTGAPILLNYLMGSGDEAFDGFLFNSPFLDWGFVGGDMIEFVLENVGLLSNTGALDNDTKVGVAATPDDFADTPIVYLNQDIVLSDWSAKLWSLYYWDWSVRPLYKVPMTVGFAKGVTDVHRKLKERYSSKQAVTSKPFLVITSRGDDVLVAKETLSRADWIGPSRWEIELNNNGHDVFLSHDALATEMAIDMALVWLKRMKFA
jgi:hypothetical protein